MTPEGAGNADLARSARLASGLAAAGAVILTIWADQVRLGMGVWETLLDVAVGAAYLVAALISPVTVAQRLLVASVGASWLLASWVAVPPLHQGALLVALAAFSTGRLNSIGSRVLAGVAVAVALGVLTQPVVAGAFAAICVVRFPGSGSGRADQTWYPVVAGAGVAAALAAYWYWSRGGQVMIEPFVAYQLVLAMVAVGHVVGSRRLRVARSGRLIAPFEGPASRGVAGRLAALAPLLRDALVDPTLTVREWAEPGDGPIDPGDDGPDRPRGQSLIVRDRDARPQAVVESAALARLDPELVEAVVTSVRLTVTGGLWQEEQDRQLAELETARDRLLASVDAQRESMATRLRDDVLIELDRARQDIERATRGPGHDDAADVLAVVSAELEASSDEVMALVAGAAPPDLGGGGLAGALSVMAARSPVPVTLHTSPTSVAARESEIALFYACSEALANAIRHSGATGIEIVLTRQGGELVLAVSDDGTGGADPAGTGLVALSDRMASCGGRLEIASRSGAGTTLTASVPISPKTRSAATG